MMHNAPKTLLWALALAGLVAAGCGDRPEVNYPTEPVNLEDTSLGPGDVFEVRVYKQEEMTNTYSVGAGGMISFPLIGELKVSGKRPEEIRAEIETALGQGYLVSPQVSVLVKEYRSKKIAVLGQVKSPGTLTFTDGMTIVEAISSAGGFTGMAKKDEVTVRRVRDDQKASYSIPVESIAKGDAPNFFVRPGDVVFVPERLF